MTKPLLLRSNYLYIFGLVLLVVSMPLSKYVTSISQFVLGASFLFEGNFIEKFKRFFKNKAALVIVGILALHLIGMLWTENAAEGWKDIRIKIPIFALTVIIAGNEPLSRQQFKLVLNFFIAAVVAGSLISMAVLAGLIPHPVNDIRDVFIFKISHIRFSLFTCIAIYALLYFTLNTPETYKKILYLILLIWLVAFLFIVESLTGLFILFTVAILLLIYYGWTSEKIITKISLISLAIAIPFVAFIQLKNIYNDYYSKKPYPVDVNLKTSEGNNYTFDLSQNDMENGYPVWVYVSEKELKEEWNSRSLYKYDSLDKRAQEIKYTLIRFLTSKGWRKDAQAVKQLSAEEIHSIENGIANVNYQELSNLRARLLQIVWEQDHFMQGEGPGGHSVMQRLESWKAACGIIQRHPWLGVGTGDLPQAFHEQYQQSTTNLNPKYWIRSHNQYLAIAVAFGFIGLLYFIFALIYPGFAMNKMRDYFYLTFLITALLSMLTEDTLETQAGATFFAFFNAFFLFGRSESKKS